MVLGAAVAGTLHELEPGRWLRRSVDQAESTRQLAELFATHRAMRPQVPAATEDALSEAVLRRQLVDLQATTPARHLDAALWEAHEDLEVTGRCGRASTWDPGGLALTLHARALTGLEVLDLSGHGLCLALVGAIIAPLAVARGLRVLNLAHNHLDDQAMAPLLTSLMFWPALEQLRLDDNPWGPTAADMLRSALDCTMPTAASLDAAVATGLVPRDLPEAPVCAPLIDLGPRAAFTPAFQALIDDLPARADRLARSKSTAAAPAAAVAARRDLRLAEVRAGYFVEGGVALTARLRTCRDGDEVAATLIRASTSVPRLESLDLSGHSLGRAASLDIIWHLAGRAMSLRYLSLRGADLHDDAIVGLGRALPALPELRGCDLRGARPGPAATQVLLAGIRRAPSLVAVLVEEPLRPAVMAALARVAPGLAAHARTAAGGEAVPAGAVRALQVGLATATTPRAAGVTLALAAALMASPWPSPPAAAEPARVALKDGACPAWAADLARDDAADPLLETILGRIRAGVAEIVARRQRNSDTVAALVAAARVEPGATWTTVRRR